MSRFKVPAKPQWKVELITHPYTYVKVTNRKTGKVTIHDSKWSWVNEGRPPYPQYVDTVVDFYLFNPHHPISFKESQELMALSS